MRVKLPVAVLAALLSIAVAPAGASLRAGAARADLTPPIGTPMFAYTARSAIAGGHVDRPMQVVADPDPHLYAKTFVPSKGIHTRVSARAIVLDRDGTKFALVQADLGGVPYALTHAVAERIASAGIAEENLLLSATHTHSSTGPIWPADNNGYAALGGDLFDPRVFQLTADGIAEAILRADHALRPAKLGVGSTTLRGASRNRSYEPYLKNEGVPADPAAAEAASIDPELTVVRVDDRRGLPIAVWSNFAVHPTSFGDGNLLFSGDNAGITEELVSRELGRRVKGREVVDVWTNGNQGDISPDGGPDQVGGEAAEWVTSDFAGAHMAGRRVADGVLRAWRDAGDHMSTATPVQARRSFMTFDGTSADGEPVGPLQVLGAGVVQEGMCAPFDGMAGPGQGRKFPGVAGAGLVPNVVPVAMWKIGSLGVAALPSEITKTMGARIRASLRKDAGGAFDRLVIAGLSNAYVSYTATPEEYDTCQYEGSFTLFGRRQGARLLDMTRPVMKSLLAGEPAPAGIAPPALGIGTTSDLPARRTPEAGAAVAQPAAAVERYGRATFSWKGGDPAVDAPRGGTFVRLQRRSGKRWRTVLTDATFRDTTAREAGDVYTETFQLDACDPAGTYRFAVAGRADRGDGVGPYELASQPFAVTPLKLSATAPVVVDGVATFRGLYPSPGDAALMALPRLVRDGEATVRVGDVVVRVPADAATGTFRVPVPAGAAVTVLGIRDACGNAT